MITALARQELSRTEQAGLLAGAALAVAAERMGGRPPEPFLKGEEELRAKVIAEARRRLKIAPGDVSDEALRAIEDELDAEMEAVAEPVDEEAALARAAHLVSGIALVERRCIEAHSHAVSAVAVTPDGRRAVSGSDDRMLKVWDLEQGALLATLEGHGKAVLAVAVTPDGRRAVSGSYDATLKVWDLEQGALLATLEGHGDGVLAVAVTPDGRRAVSGSLDRTLKVWDLEHGALLATLEGHGDWVKAVAVTPDSRRAVSGSDVTLRLWDLQTWAELARFEADRPFFCCAVTFDGRTFVAGDSAGHLHLLDVTA